MVKKSIEDKAVIVNPEEEYAYGYIIKALASGLYHNKFDVIREYVLNAYNAVVKWEDLNKVISNGIKIIIKKPSISICDYGTGMNEETINAYRKVGFSKKKAGEVVGFRGIGKLSGISVAKKLIITTSPEGIEEKYTLEFDADSMIKELDDLKKNQKNIPLNELIEEYTAIKTEKEKKNEHYTSIQLYEIKENSKDLLNKNKLKDYISKNAPVEFDPNSAYKTKIENGIKKFVKSFRSVKISVNGVKTYKPLLENVMKPGEII
ncbi:MAG: ATP-binding protein, partial [Actinomycetia bacterium]|nr:ATP-binding protein [Actinomycetes bacterium]